MQSQRSAYPYYLHGLKRVPLIDKINIRTSMLHQVTDQHDFSMILPRKTFILETIHIPIQNLLVFLNFIFRI